MQLWTKSENAIAARLGKRGKRPSKDKELAGSRRHRDPKRVLRGRYREEMGVSHEKLWWSTVESPQRVAGIPPVRGSALSDSPG